MANCLDGVGGEGPHDSVHDYSFNPPNKFSNTLLTGRDTAELCGRQNVYFFFFLTHTVCDCRL